MPKYEAILRRKCWSYSTVIIHAPDLESAKRKATRAGRLGTDGEGGDAEWHTVHSPRQSIHSIMEVK